MEDEEIYELKRPLSIMVVAPILMFVGGAGFLGRIYLEMSGQTPIDSGVIVQLLVLAGGIGLWLMKKWGFWMTLISIIFVVGLNSAVSGKPLRDFICIAFPLILAVFALVKPHYKRME